MPYALRSLELSQPFGPDRRPLLRPAFAPSALRCSAPAAGCAHRFVAIALITGTTDLAILATSKRV